MPDRPGRKIRVAYSVDILKKRLADAEQASTPDAMELVGIWDELSRVDRKWREQSAQGSERRSERDEPNMAGWFERLIRLLERSLRPASIPEAERAALAMALQKCRERKPIPPISR